MSTLLHLATALALAGASGAQAQVAPGSLGGKPNARLFLTIEAKGTGRKDLANKVEWYRLTASRKLEMEMQLTPLQGAAPLVPVGGIDKDNAPLPAGHEAIRQALEPCKGNESCHRRVMMEIGQRMMANPQALGSMRQDHTRFENWMVDFRGPCAKGALTVEDEGDGMNISPPAAAKPYKFQRVGKLDLPGQAREVLDKACRIEVSVDRQTGRLSLRLNRFDFAVPVRLTGQAYTSEKSVPFLERSGKLEVLDQKIDVKAKSASGQVTIEKIGTVSHNSGQTVAPLSAILKWRLVRD